MKASQLIFKLVRLIAKHGDIPVLYRDNHDWALEIGSVWIEKEQDEIDSVCETAGYPDNEVPKVPVILVGC